MDYNQNTRIEAWALQALTADGLEAEMAANRLREAGSRSVDVLLAMRKAATDTTRIDDLIDRVAGQRYACVSGLYWYTDLEKAKAEAAASGKPILSLRMLGKLTEEFSCANSRFFRTTLYANEEIARELRERFVLHWKSVRPVPRVTIDFGDGRKLERTITGNSVHYVLAADGQPLDALPGLYGPRQFQSWLSEVETLHENTRSLAAPTERHICNSITSITSRQIAGRGPATWPQWRPSGERVCQPAVKARAFGSASDEDGDAEKQGGDADPALDGRRPGAVGRQNDRRRVEQDCRTHGTRR